jgi:deoxyribodipyrimidine photo-lyase
MDRIWRPGEAGAHERLKAFLDSALGDYAVGRERPDRDGVSRLSPYLHWGEISPHQVWQAVCDFSGGRALDRASTETYLRELGWREFAHHLLYHFPHTAEQSMDTRFEDYPWQHDEAALTAWQRGRTGFPLVDAGMRQLWRSGWMHNRVRMVVASFLTKNLRIHWLEGARWFWDTLVDADLASNSLGWQWTAGCGVDAAPYFRVFNPTRQGERYDPEADYVARWIPELAGLSARWRHQPRAAPEAELRRAGITLGETYPHPLVDLGRSRRQALDGYQRIRHRTA